MAQVHLKCPTTQRLVRLPMSISGEDPAVPDTWGKQSTECPYCGKKHRWIADNLVLLPDDLPPVAEDDE